MATDWDQTRGGLLKKLRKTRNLSQEDLGEKAQVNPTQISRYENARGSPSAETLKRLAGALGVSVYVFTAGDDWKTVEKAAIVRDHANADTMRSDPLVTDFLSDEIKRIEPLYPHARRMLKWDLGGITLTIPVAVFADDVSIKLGSLDLDIRRRPGAETDDYVLQLQRISKDLYNGIVYTMRNAHVTSSSCTIDGGVTDFFSVLAQHERLEHELLSVAYDLRREGTADAVLRAANLTERNAFLAQSRSERRAYSTLGISTVLVYNDGRRFRTMVQKRSSETAVHPNLFHVIPACGFSTEINPEIEWDIQLCVVREYCEELFRITLEKGRRNPRYIYSEWEPARELLDAIERGGAELLPCGVIFHLMSFRSCICCLLLIRDAAWFETQSRRFRPNWEYMPSDELLKVPGPRAVTDFDLDRIEAQFVDTITRAHGGSADAFTGNWDPAGLGALWLGVNAARKILAKR
jgi:transcriptional regulator with XRE-family HTH domain